MTVGSASLQFLSYAFAVVFVLNFSRSVAWRQFILLAASVGFLGFFSLHPLAFVPLAAFLAYGFVSLRLMQAEKTNLYAPLLLLGIVAFMWLKKYAFIPAALFLAHPYLTLGLSYIFFRALHLIIDARNGELPPNISLVSYLNYMLNFTTLLSGPIQRYEDFAAMQLAPVPLPLNVIVTGEALERIIVGFFKVNVLSLFFSMIQANALHSLNENGPATVRILNGILIAAVYPFYLYCNFSGYIDIVIGIARFLRIALPENFITFWSRWHITLSTWLKTYVYNRLLMVTMRRWPSPAVEPFLGVFAFFVTFFLIGVWHGQSSVFILFGVLQGLGVSVTKLYQVLMAKWIGRKQYKELARNGLYNVATRGLTFTWFAFTSLWFWSNWEQLDVLARSFHTREIALVWLLIFVGSSVMLAIWEAMREWLLAFQFQGQPLLLSRYVRTAWNTTLVVISIGTITLLNAPPPDIVYKTF
jgi:alginate O-acetyltransferase complex protein AlgI